MHILRVVIYEDIFYEFCYLRGNVSEWKQNVTMAVLLYFNITFEVLKHFFVNVNVLISAQANKHWAGKLTPGFAFALCQRTATQPMTTWKLIEL